MKFLINPDLIVVVCNAKLLFNGSINQFNIIYYQDASFQCHVLSKLGYKVKSCAIVHINNQYVRHGDLDINELFTVEDITADAAMLQPDVSDNIDSIREYMLQPEEPTDDIGEHCFSPYFCGFFGHCTKHLPTPNVFDVAGARTSTKLKCYNKGIISFEDLNTCDVFSSSQYKQIEHELFGYHTKLGAQIPTIFRTHPRQAILRQTLTI